MKGGRKPNGKKPGGEKINPEEAKSVRKWYPKQRETILGKKRAKNLVKQSWVVPSIKARW